jgi:hypothetical protein
MAKHEFFAKIENSKFKFQNHDEFINLVKANEGANVSLNVNIHGLKKGKTAEAHNYFISVVCPSYCHAIFEAGEISKSMFKMLTIEDCIYIVKQTFFVTKQENGLKICESLKMDKWGFDEWNLKSQAIIDTILQRYGYVTPASDIKHQRNYLKLLRESI